VFEGDWPRGELIVGMLQKKSLSKFPILWLKNRLNKHENRYKREKRN
jgi:hypothetical protein